MAVVLVIEDDDQVRVFAEAILQEHGHQTLTARTVQEALAILKGDAALDLLFTDLELSDDHESGLRVAREATALRPEMSVLYTTGVGVTDATRALFVERWSFLAKPYTPHDLITAVANALAN